VGTLNELRDQLAALIVETRSLDLSSLYFADEDSARFAAVLLIGIALVVLLLRLLTRRSSGRGRLGLPSLIEWARPNRMMGKYRDMMALVEFGDQAYVITPFTTDYENILFSMSLIGDWTEFMSFPDQGTIIANAIEQSAALFRAFDVLDAAGNAMVIFTDGIDAEVTEDGRSAFDVLKDARDANIPVYFIRTGVPGRGQAAIPDEVWAAAVARTGGKFFTAVDESAVVRAVQEIDRAAPGRVEMKRYTTEQPRFSGFAVLGAAFWAVALLMRLTLPWFQTFP